MKCNEAPEEDVLKGTEKFLQLSCFIEKGNTVITFPYLINVYQLQSLATCYYDRYSYQK